MIFGISGLAGSGKDTFAKFMEPLGATNVALADPLKRIALDIYDFSEEQLWGPSQFRNAPDYRYPRPHTWIRGQNTDEHEMTCSCCGAGADRRRVEDDLFVVNEDDVPGCHLTPRYALQLLGTEWGRQCYPDTWAAKCVRTAKMLLQDHRLRYNPRRGTFRLSEAQDWVDADLQEAWRTRLVTVSDVRFKNEMRVIREAGGKIIRVRRPGAGLGGAAGLHPSEAEQMSIPDKEFDLVIVNDGTLEELQAKAEALTRW